MIRLGTKSHSCGPNAPYTFASGLNPHSRIVNHPIFELLAALEEARLHFTLGRHRPDTILVTITLVGERVEVDVFEDGHMEVCRFRGNETIEGEVELAYALIREQRG